MTFLPEETAETSCVESLATVRSTGLRFAGQQWRRVAGTRAYDRQPCDPYTLSVLDIDGRVGIEYGVYGVPETYVIDKAGVIRMKHTGPITPDIFSGKILPLLAELSK